MARRRTISPTSWTDEKLADLDAWPHLLWVGLVSFSDDEGRVEWKPTQIRLNIFPAKNCTDEDVAAWMQILHDRGLVVRYESNGRQFGYHPAWHRHQSTNRPTESRLPDPPGVLKKFIRTPKGGIRTRGAEELLDNPSLFALENSVSPIWRSVSPIRNTSSGSSSGSISNTGEREAQAPPEISKIPEIPAISEPRPEPAIAAGALTGVLDRSASPAIAFAEWFVAEAIAAGALTGVLDRSASPAIAFAEWFVAEAIAAGALTGVLDEVAHAWRELEIAGRLLAAHGRDECAIRAHRLFTAHLSTGRDRIYRPPTLAALEAWWDSPQLSLRKSPNRPLRSVGASSPGRAAGTERVGAGWKPPARRRGYFTLGADGGRVFVEASA